MVGAAGRPAVAGASSAAGHQGPTVVLSERLGEVTDHERRLERELGATLVSAPLWAPEDIRAHATDADAIVIGAVEPFHSDVLRALPRCRLVVRRGVGCDNVDLQAATELGIPVAYVPDASVEEVSDHALALMLALERRVVALNGSVHDGAWANDPAAVRRIRQDARRLSTLTLGVVGCGRIGRALIRKSNALFDRIIASDPQVTDDEVAAAGAALVPFDQLVREADLISIHAPLTPATTHLFDRGVFAAMRPATQLVNTSRGGLVDEDALVWALQTGNLAGAALDVTEHEPLADDSPLLSLPNVILTGHSAAHSTTATGELRRRAVDALIAAFGEGQQPPLANPEVVNRNDCRLVFRSHP